MEMLKVTALWICSEQRTIYMRETWRLSRYTSNVLAHFEENYMCVGKYYNNIPNIYLFVLVAHVQFNVHTECISLYIFVGNIGISLANTWDTSPWRVCIHATETHVTVLGHSNHSVTEKGIITIDLRGNSHFFQKCVYLHVTVRGMWNIKSQNVEFILRRYSYIHVDRRV